MKKQMILLIASGIFISCSADDDLQECKEQVWRMSGNCVNNVCNYTLEYGADEDNTTKVSINQATYDFYSDKFNDDDPRDCWEGLK